MFKTFRYGLKPLSDHGSKSINGSTLAIYFRITSEGLGDNPGASLVLSHPHILYKYEKGTLYDQVTE